jgi:hypothetical protein
MRKSKQAVFLTLLSKEQRNFPAAAGELRCQSLHSAQILSQFNATAWLQPRICDQCRLEEVFRYDTALFARAQKLRLFDDNRGIFVEPVSVTAWTSGYALCHDGIASLANLI